MRPSLAAAALLLLIAPAARGQTIDTLALSAHTYFLAHDLLGGRGTASPGERLAALYIVSELRRMGIEGAGPGGEYLQPVPLRRIRADDGATYFVLSTDSAAADRPSGAAVVDDVVAHNIAALIPGSDPARRDEVVAFTAHYDHLGIGAPDENGDSIFNGFSDNAAGVAMLLAIADEIRKDPPARSTLFLFFTGEEQGLLGSTHYVSAPLVPLERTVAVINLDAGAPPAPPIVWRIAGGTQSSLGEDAARIAEERGWTTQLERARPNSDYWPFLQKGVPAAFIIPGRDWEGLSPEEQQRLFERWDRYHQRGDEWKPDFPWAGLQRYAEIGLALGRHVANAPERPRLTP